MGAGQADEEGSACLAMNDQLLLYFYTKCFFSPASSSVKLYLDKTGCPTLMAVTLRGLQFLRAVNGSFGEIFHTGIVLNQCNSWPASVLLVAEILGLQATVAADRGDLITHKWKVSNSTWQPSQRQSSSLGRAKGHCEVLQPAAVTKGPCAL